MNAQGEREIERWAVSKRKGAKRVHRPVRGRLQRAIRVVKDAHKTCCLAPNLNLCYLYNV